MISLMNFGLTQHTDRGVIKKMKNEKGETICSFCYSNKIKFTPMGCYVYMFCKNCYCEEKSDFRDEQIAFEKSLEKSQETEISDS